MSLILPNELGPTLVKDVASRFMLVQKDHRYKLNEFIEDRIQELFSTLSAEDIAEGKKQLKEGVSAGEIKKRFIKQKKIKRPEKGSLKHSLQTILDEAATKNFFHSPFIVEVPKEKSLMDFAQCATITAQAVEETTTNKLALSFIPTTVRITRKIYAVQTSFLNLIIRGHSIERYMTRNNQNCSNEFFRDIESTMETFFPTMLAMIFNHKKMEEMEPGDSNRYAASHPMIILPMSKGLCFGYLSEQVINARPMTVSSPKHTTEIIRPFSDFLAVVINTYIDYDSLDETKTALYAKWRRLLETNKVLFKTLFYNYFLKMQKVSNVYTILDQISEFRPLFDILIPLINSEEWKEIEASHCKHDRDIDFIPVGMKPKLIESKRLSPLTQIK